MILEQSSVDLDTSTGAMRAYVYAPKAAGRRPGVVLFSEIFQRTGPIGRMAAMLAGHGFVVAVPEIFHELEIRPAPTRATVTRWARAPRGTMKTRASRSITSARTRPATASS
jgi:carboxymethylenebutenolidase